MGIRAWFKRLLEQPPEPTRQAKPKAAKRKPPAPVVRVAPLTDRWRGERSGGWAYYWRAEGVPRLGQRVLVPFGFDDKQEEFRIIGFGRDGYKGPLKSITEALD